MEHIPKLKDASAGNATSSEPDLKRPLNMQDKRATIPIEFEDVDLWLFGTVEDASKLLALRPADLYAAEPVAR